MKGTIGIIHSDESKQGITHDFFASVIEGFRQECNENNYNIAFLNSIRDEKNKDTYLEQIKENGYAGVLIACSETNAEIEELLSSDIIVGTVDKDYERVINVSSDNTEGMKALMEHIISNGHKKIAIITGDDNLVCNMRLGAYIKACEMHDIKIDDDYILRGHFRDIDKAYYLTEKLLKLPVAPTCIIYSDDYAAIGGINAIHSRGLEIPRHISVAGYDGNLIMSQLEPRLTTVYQDTGKMGRSVAKRMIEGIENPQNVSYSTEIVATTLREGHSVGRVYEF
ncbi:MAG: substrate-binding domain-containing protein [Lachnospiraceae bacterium]|nr:substrate-binding domain-containing protein [Lachnospiraceae bacterium]